MFKIKSLDIFFIFFVLVILSLGTWQILRLNSKKNLISQLEVNLKKNSTSFNKDINKYMSSMLQKGWIEKFG